jgi:hypothetical protein
VLIRPPTIPNHARRLARVGVHAIIEKEAWNKEPVRKFTSFGEFMELYGKGGSANAEERLCINWSGLASALGGPCMAGRDAIEKNAGQRWQNLFKDTNDFEMHLLVPQPGDRGYHERRSANFKIKIGGRWVSVAQKPTVQKVKQIYEDEWVKTGLVSIGVAIENYERRLVPTSDGNWESKLIDVSGRHLTLTDHFTPRLQRARDSNFLRSMPPYMTDTPIEFVFERLRQLQQDDAADDEPEEQIRHRLRVAELCRRSERCQPAASACNHCGRTTFCSTCHRPKVVGCVCGAGWTTGCLPCTRRGKKDVTTLRGMLDGWGESVVFEYDATPEAVAQQLLEQVVLIEADDDNQYLLVEQQLPARLPNENDYGREQRLAKHLNLILLWTWAGAHLLLI